MQIAVEIVERTVNLNDDGTRTAVQVWFRPQLKANGRTVWSSDTLVANGLVARALAHELLASGLLPAIVGA